MVTETYQCAELCKTRRNYGFKKRLYRRYFERAARYDFENSPKPKISKIRTRWENHEDGQLLIYEAEITGKLKEGTA